MMCSEINIAKCKFSLLDLGNLLLKLTIESINQIIKNEDSIPKASSFHFASIQSLEIVYRGVLHYHKPYEFQIHISLS